HCRTPSPPYEWSSAQSGVKKLDGEILRPAVSRSLREEPRDQTSRVDGGLGNQVSGGIPGLIRHASRCTRPAVQPFAEAPVLQAARTSELDELPFRLGAVTMRSQQRHPEAADHRPDA